MKRTTLLFAWLFTICFSAVQFSGCSAGAPPIPTSFVLVTGGALFASSKLGAASVNTFYIGKTEVTWKEWVTIRDWAVVNGYTDLDGVGEGKGDNYPVTTVNWFDVVKWCNARSEKEGRAPVYKNVTEVYRNGNVFEPAIVASANGYRLPSEKEWEFAARGGTQTQVYTYSGSNDLHAVAWREDYPPRFGTHEVGEKLGNELGIHDMSGNVSEWTGSWYPGKEGSSRVIRGGCWYSFSAEDCSVAFRNGRNPGEDRNDGSCVGFRVALSSVP